MAEMRDWKQVKAELLSDPDVRVEYEALRPQFELIKQVIEGRQALGLTQTDLAEIVGTKQSNISRFESGDYNPSLEFLEKVARGLGRELHIELRAPASPPRQ